MFFKLGLVIAHQPSVREYKALLLDEKVDCVPAFQYETAGIITTLELRFTGHDLR